MGQSYFHVCTTNFHPMLQQRTNIGRNLSSCSTRIDKGDVHNGLKDGGWTVRRGGGCHWDRCCGKGPACHRRCETMEGALGGLTQYGIHDEAGEVLLERNTAMNHE